MTAPGSPTSVFSGNIRQLGYVVTNIDEAIAAWNASMGVGPWFVQRAFRYSKFLLRGVPSQPHVSIALSYSGDTQIELIQQNDEAPSMYAEFTRSGRAGLQHIAYWPRDLEASLDRALSAGWTVGQTIETPRGPLHYLEHPLMNFAVEIAGLTDERQATFTAIQAACKAWDGITLIRESWPG